MTVGYTMTGHLMARHALNTAACATAIGSGPGPPSRNPVVAPGEATSATRPLAPHRCLTQRLRQRNLLSSGPGACRQSAGNAHAKPRREGAHGVCLRAATGTRRGIARLASRAGTTVDVALVLAIDVSGSVSEARMMLQRRGYSDALCHPGFVQAVRSGPTGRVALTFVQWSEARRQEQSVAWRVIEDAATARQFAAGDRRRRTARCRAGRRSARRSIISARLIAQQRPDGAAQGDRRFWRRWQQRRPRT